MVCCSSVKIANIKCIKPQNAINMSVNLEKRTTQAFYTKTRINLNVFISISFSFKFLNTIFILNF